MRSSESLNLISLSSHRVRIWYPKGVYKCGKFTELSTMCYFLVPFTVFSLACDSSIWALWHEATIIPKRNHNSRTKRTEKPNFKAFQDHFIINSFDRASTGSGDPPSTLWTPKRVIENKKEKQHWHGALRMTLALRKAWKWKWQNIQIGLQILSWELRETATAHSTEGQNRSGCLSDWEGHGEWRPQRVGENAVIFPWAEEWN
jgi:hypothetical protein